MPVRGSSSFCHPHQPAYTLVITTAGSYLIYLHPYSYTHQWVLQSSTAMPTTHSAIAYTNRSCCPVRATPNNPHQACPQSWFLCLPACAMNWSGLSHITFSCCTHHWTSKPYSTQPTSPSSTYLCRWVATTCLARPASTPGSHAHPWELQTIRNSGQPLSATILVALGL